MKRRRKARNRLTGGGQRQTAYTELRATAGENGERKRWFRDRSVERKVRLRRHPRRKPGQINLDAALDISGLCHRQCYLAAATLLHARFRRIYSDPGVEVGCIRVR